MIRNLLVLCLLGLSSVLRGQDSGEDAALAHSVEELRGSIGRWDVVTEFLGEDGSVARSVSGTYEFSWIVADRVVTGKTEIPELKMAAGILFYINDKEKIVEMVSVGADGKLWIMTGPLGEDHRTTQAFETGAGGKRKMRFTRYNVSADAFESKMEYTDDDGKTWTPGNHQQFKRAKS